MARKPERYSDLDDANDVCSDRAQTYMRTSPVLISAPYHGMDEVRVELYPPVYPPQDDRSSSGVWELFAALRQSFKASPRGLLGWSSRHETFFLDNARADARLLEEASSDLTIGPKKRIRDYARKAIVAFDAIEEIYKKYEFHIKYPWVDDKNRKMPIALSEWEEEWRAWVHPDAGIWDAGRYKAREEIRRKWDRGMSYLWCAMVGMAEAEALAGNKVKVEELEIPAGDTPGQVNPVPLPTPGDIVPVPDPTPGDIVPVPPSTPGQVVPVPVEPLKPAHVKPVPVKPDLDPGDPDGDDTPDDVPPDDVPPDQVVPESKSGVGVGVLAAVAVVGFLLLRGR